MWQMKNLMVKNKATSKRNLLLCSNTFQLPPLQTLNPYITTLGSIWLEAIGNSARNLGVTGVIPKISWCYISSASKKKKKKKIWQVKVVPGPPSHTSGAATDPHFKSIVIL